MAYLSCEPKLCGLSLQTSPPHQTASLEGTIGSPVSPLGGSSGLSLPSWPSPVRLGLSIGFCEVSVKYMNRKIPALTSVKALLPLLSAFWWDSSWGFPTLWEAGAAIVVRFFWLDSGRQRLFLCRALSHLCLRRTAAVVWKMVTEMGPWQHQAP